MRFRQRLSSYVLALAALAFAVLAGIVIPLFAGGSPGVDEPDWTPPPATKINVRGEQVTVTVSPSATARRTIAPTNTASPRPSPTSTAPAPTRPAPTATATVPSTARILQGATNLRAGPGTGYPVLGTANAGDQYRITGRSEDSRWVQVCCISGTPAWVSATLAELPAAVEAFPTVR